MVLDNYSLVTQSGRSEVVYNWLQYFDLEALKQELEGAGFKVQAMARNKRGERALARYMQS